jgi:hypothetical protein
MLNMARICQCNKMLASKQFSPIKTAGRNCSHQPAGDCCRHKIINQMPSNFSQMLVKTNLPEAFIHKFFDFPLDFIHRFAYDLSARSGELLEKSRLETHLRRIL